jgi:uncharacterized integral membrane protein
MKFISGLLGFLVIFMALAFALSNRQDATISLWPLGVEIQAPLYLLTLGTFLFGILVGAVIAWFAMIPHRMKARQLRKDLAALQGKVVDLQQTVLPPQTHDDDFLLAGPKSKRRFWESRS